MSQTTSGSRPGVDKPFENLTVVALTETPEELAYELSAAEGSLWTGARLAIGIGLFSDASLAFAYFYLRSANNEDLWRPHGMTAPTASGAAIMAFTVAAAGLALLAVRRLRSNQIVDWRVAGWTAVLSALIALGLQVWQLTQLSFHPGASGYSSCFIGWAVMNILTILGGAYWTETLLARHIRLQRAHAEEGGSAGAPLPAHRLFRANAEGSAAFWLFIAAGEVFFWLLFYVL
jgi:heme/copper-type cytochrome/quinol oxidase subunit 3